MGGLQSLFGAAMGFACTASALEFTVIPAPTGGQAIHVFTIKMLNRSGASNGVAIREGASGTERLHLSAPNSGTAPRGYTNALVLAPGVGLFALPDATINASSFISIDVEYLLSTPGA